MSELSKWKLEKAIKRHLEEDGSILDVFDKDVMKEIEDKDKTADQLLKEMLTCQLDKKLDDSHELAEKLFKNTRELDDLKDDEE